MADPIKTPMNQDEENCSGILSEISKLIQEDNPATLHKWGDLMFGFGMKCLLCGMEVTRVHMNNLTRSQKEALLHERCPATEDSQEA